MLLNILNTRSSEARLSISRFSWVPGRWQLALKDKLGAHVGMYPHKAGDEFDLTPRAVWSVFAGLMWTRP